MAEPVAPDPAASELIVSDPVAPGSVASDPVAPGSMASDPVAPGSAAPDPTGLELASQIARAARGQKVFVRRRPRPGQDEAAWSGAGPSGRDPQPVGALLDRVIVERGWRQDLAVAALLGHWADFVGQANANHCRPAGFKDGRLLVQADSTAWASAIRLLAPQLVAKLNSALGDQTVTAVKVLGPQVRSWKRGRRSVPGRGPRDTCG
ncbi:MAG: DciA family protein [Propionibacteriaceae bacterium]|jgi:predicted nucleic acid-binding Zn ribbon protein|nr:DciA family protein [Propionibacteriaceae bacterium]